MFAVPGWSVAADKLKVQVEGSSEKNRKKRKRGSKREDVGVVDASNVAELWEQHVEKKGKVSKSSKNKHSKRNEELKHETGIQNQQSQEQNDASGETGTVPKEESSTKESKPKKGKKEKKEKQHKPKGTENQPQEMEVPAIALAPEPPQLPPTSTLTPLQAQMRQKLIGSRFRYLNETLYTTPSSSSQTLFTENPSFFTEYHEGFRRQVSTWPENPVDGFVKWLLERGKLKPSKHPNSTNNNKDPRQRYRKPGKSPPPDKPATATSDPLPRNAAHRGHSTIVDLGCGDAKLAQAIQASTPNASAAQRLKLSVKSFDLAAPNELVTVADIRALPLPDGSVDVAIFCLALMGTNWIEFVEEAYRVLRWKGECWVAEVASRFGGSRKKGSGRVEHSVGNKVKPDTDKGGRNGKGKGIVKKGPEEKEEEVVGPEEQGMVEDVTARPVVTTDVSAFVEVLGKRGFVLQGEPEMGNKMFVRMRFLKAAPAVRGKCAKKKEDELQQMPKFIDREDRREQITVEEEARVLKPCVYKTR